MEEETEYLSIQDRGADGADNQTQKIRETLVLVTHLIYFLFKSNVYFLVFCRKSIFS